MKRAATLKKYSRTKHWGEQHSFGAQWGRGGKSCQLLDIFTLRHVGGIASGKWKKPGLPLEINCCIQLNCCVGAAACTSWPLNVIMSELNCGSDDGKQLDRKIRASAATETRLIYHLWWLKGRVLFFRRKQNTLLHIRAKQTKINWVTHYWNVSLYFGDQLLFLVLVLNFRFLSARCGPRALTSTNGRNMALVCQMRLFTATTEEASRKEKKQYFQTLNHHFVKALCSKQVKRRCGFSMKFFT